MAEALAVGRAAIVAAGQRGVFAGYASLFGVPDSTGDVVMAGAFAASLARRGPAGIRMLFQHDASQPIGTWLELREDSRGLLVRGRLASEVQRAEELASLLHEGAIDGLSIGFRAVLASRDRITRQRRLVRIDLWEISLVTFPMLDGKAPGTGRSEARHALRSPGGHALRAYVAEGTVEMLPERADARSK